MPEIPFSIAKDKQTIEFLELNGDEIGLITSSIGDYEDFIVLNKKNKTVSRDREAICVRVNEKKYPEIITEYNRKLSSIPIAGRWKCVKNSVICNVSAIKCIY